MTEPIASDKLEGARAIAEFFGWTGDDEAARLAGERKVRHLRARAAGCPIRKQKAIGIYAFKSELEAWLKGEETLPGQHAA